MKPYLLVAALLLATLPATAQSLTGHVVSVQNKHSAGVVSTYNSNAGQWNHGVVAAHHRETDIRVGNIVYSLVGIDKHIQVGKDYPVRVEKDRMWITIENGKEKKFRIEGQAESK
jgi:hypothetical protein